MGVEGEDSEGGDEGGGAATRETDALAPGDSGGAVFVWVAVAGAGDEVDFFAQAARVVLHDNGETMG